MILAHSPTSTSITLSDNFIWTDEHSWVAATATVSYLMTGALLVEGATRQAGRFITLEAASDVAWVRRSLLQQIYALASVQGQVMTLSMLNPSAPGTPRVFNVMFRHQETPINADPVNELPSRTDDEWWHLKTIRLMEVAEWQFQQQTSN